MAAVAAIAPVISTVATIAGTVISYAGTIAAGKAQQQAANYEAQQLDIKAKEEQAAAQREAEQFRRRKELALSSLQTRAAASGFTTTDPTALNLAEETEKYGTVQEQLAMYGGTSRRAGLEGQAAAARMSGQAAMQGARYKALGTVISGIGSLADRYAPRQSDPAAPGNLYYGGGGTRTSSSRVYYG